MFLLAFVVFYSFLIENNKNMIKKNAIIEIIYKNNTYELVVLYNVLTFCANIH